MCLTLLDAQMQAGPTPTVPTPFGEANRLSLAGCSGELIYLGARPGVGKTALGLECARRAAKYGVGVLIVSVK